MFFDVYLFSDRVLHVYILTFSLSVKQMLEEDSRLKAVESCECIKSCHFNGSVEADGSTWTDGCDVCSCVVCMTFIHFYSLFENSSQSTCLAIFKKHKNKTIVPRNEVPTLLPVLEIHAVNTEMRR